MSCGAGNKISRGSHAVLSNLSVEQNPRQASERKGRKKNPATNCKTKHRFQGLQGRVGKGLGEGLGLLGRNSWDGASEAVQGYPPGLLRASWGWRGRPEQGGAGRGHLVWAELSLLSITSNLWISEITCHSFHLRQDWLLTLDRQTLGLLVLKISRFLQSFLPLIPGSHMKWNSNSPCCTLSTVLVLYPPGRTPRRRGSEGGSGAFLPSLLAFHRMLPHSSPVSAGWQTLAGSFNFSGLQLSLF